MPVTRLALVVLTLLLAQGTPPPAAAAPATRVGVVTEAGAAHESAPLDLDSAAAAVPARVAAQVDPNVVVQITSPRPGQRLRGRVEITGYAADRRSPSGSGLNERDIQIYLNDSADPWNLFDYALAGRESAEAAAALGPGFAQTGFWDAWETCTFPEGPYKLIVWASSLVTAGARNFAMIDVYVESCPQGEIVAQAGSSSEPGGMYALRLDGPDTRGSSLEPIYADFAAGIDARCVDAAVDCRYGLDFRELPGPGTIRTNTFYRFMVDPTDGTFNLGYSPPGDDPIIPIIPWTPSPAIQRGAATNRVAVIVQGNWLRLFVNGQQIGEVRDERRPWGQVGWVAATAARGRPVEVQFDNFQVSTPGPAERLAPLFPSAGAPPAPGGGAPPPAPPAAAPGAAAPGAPAPPVTGPSSARVLLADDFSNPNSGWPRESSDPASRRVGYEGGEYVVARLAGSSGSPLVTRDERFTDFLAELDARLTPPTQGAYLFLDFRRQANGDHYSFVVDPNDSTFIVLRNVGTGSEPLIPWTPAPTIQGGVARNRLGVRARGPELTFLVNGQQVGSTRDAALREGSIAFGVGSVESGPAEGRFSNLVVSSLD